MCVYMDSGGSRILGKGGGMFDRITIEDHEVSVLRDLNGYFMFFL